MWHFTLRFAVPWRRFSWLRNSQSVGSRGSCRDPDNPAPTRRAFPAGSALPCARHRAGSGMLCVPAPGTQGGTQSKEGQQSFSSHERQHFNQKTMIFLATGRVITYPRGHIGAFCPPVVFYEYRRTLPRFLVANLTLRFVSPWVQRWSLCALCWSSCTWRWMNVHALCWWPAFVTGPTWPTLLIQLYILIYWYLYFNNPAFAQVL